MHGAPGINAATCPTPENSSMQRGGSLEPLSRRASSDCTAGWSSPAPAEPSSHPSADPERELRERPPVPSDSMTTTRTATATMRAAVIAGPRQSELEHRIIPEPGPGEVRIRLEGCGVCGSSLPLWEGRPWFEYPVEAGSPGHEGWGVVDALGSNVLGVQ